MKIDFTKMPCKYWSDSTKISYIQRRIIIYSIMYYELNESCISDWDYHELSDRLIDLMKSSKQEQVERSTYYYAMQDYDGSTGFDIVNKLNEKDKKYLREQAQMILNNYKLSRSKEARRH